MQHDGYDVKLTQEAENLARKLGAELVGFGPVERWKHAPLMLSPQGLLPSAKSVIVVCVKFTDASMELTEKEMSEHWYNPYDMCEAFTGMNERLDMIAFHLAKFLEDRGYNSLYTPVSNLWRIKPYKSIDHPFAPALVHRYAAVACGLGEIGWSGLFLSPEYGSRQRIIPIVTEAALAPTPMYEGPALCNKCMECVKRCPLDCFRKEVAKINKIDIGGRIFEFPDVNKWRCYLDYYGIHGPFVPEKITEEIAVRIAHSDVKPTKSIMDSGACLCSCVPPDLRFYDEKYPRGVRRRMARKTVSAAEFTPALEAIARGNGVDYLGIAGREELRKKGIDLEEYLPDAASALLIGISNQNDGGEMEDAVHFRLRKTIFELSHSIEAKGYATLPIPRLPAGKLAEYWGFEQDGVQFSHLITELPLTPLSTVSRVEQGVGKNISSDEVKAFAAAHGADLTGISSVERLNRLYPTIRTIYEGENSIEIDIQYSPGTPTWTPKSAALKPVKIKKPEDYLPGARSVIVLGVHFPATLLERVAKPPAENIASYAGGTQGWGVGREIEALALDMARFLRESGYRAKMTWDLFNTDYGAKAWAMAKSVGANRFAAVCAGLGEIGRSGAMLTPEYGLTQRFICVITDAELAEDSLYQGPPLCKQCGKCTAACPVNAFTHELHRCEIDGKRMEFCSRDRLKCEWSVKCGLVREEGPGFLGVTKDFQPPPEITADAVWNALTQLSPVEFSWGATFEKCLSVCPTTEEVLERKKRRKS